MPFVNVDDEVVWVTAVTDVNTPPALVPLAGRIVGIPKSAIAGELTQGYPGIIYGVPGRARQGAGGWEWVMGTVDEVVIAIDELMPGGWHKVAARDGVVDMARAMLAAGISAVDTRAVCQAIINAVLLEKS